MPPLMRYRRRMKAAPPDAGCFPDWAEGPGINPQRRGQRQGTASGQSRLSSCCSRRAKDGLDSFQRSRPHAR